MEVEEEEEEEEKEAEEEEEGRIVWAGDSQECVACVREEPIPVSRFAFSLTRQSGEDIEQRPKRYQTCRETKTLRGRKLNPGLPRQAEILTIILPRT